MIAGTPLARRTAMRPPPQLLATLLLALGACGTPAAAVRSDVDAGARFDRFESFSYFQPLSLESVGGVDPRSELTRGLTRALRLELEARGYRYRHSGGDLLVDVLLQPDDRAKAEDAAATFYAYREGRYLPWPGHDAAFVDDATRGTLSIDLVDAALRRLVWNGTAERLLVDLDRDDPDPEVLRAAVAELLAAYPHRAAGAVPAAPAAPAPAGDPDPPDGG